MRIGGGRSACDPYSPFFALRPEQPERGIHCPAVHVNMQERDQKTPFHHKLTNFGMQLVNFSGIDLFWCRASARECRRQILYRSPFPCADLSRMHIVVLGQFCQRHLLTDRS